VAVLGGGLTGLSAAFHLARRHPDVEVTLYERSTRFGGWLRSERIEVEDADGNRASVLLEGAARTVRPNATSVLELIHLLDLRSEVLITPRSSPAARARFLALPSTPGLSALPSTLLSLLTTPLGRLVLRASLRECVRPANRPPRATDEAVDAFLARRFGPECARVLGSALVHGIYGADARRLSVRAAFPALWAAEERGRGSVVWGALGWPAWWGARARKAEAERREAAEGWEVGEDAGWEAVLADASVLSFTDGMGTLVGALVRALAALPNVVLKTGTEVVALSHDARAIRPAHGPAVAYAAAISALPLPALAALLPADQALPHLTHNPLTSVTSLNLVFPIARLPAPLHQPGFGYLVPRALTGYGAGAGTVGMLGVVFDSASLAAQDRALPAVAVTDAPEPPFSPPAPAPFVKVTAMVGGPHPAPAADADARALVAAVVGEMAVQLGRALPAPVAYKVHRNARSIPTYLVGHVERMGEMRRALAGGAGEKGAGSGGWGGRLKVVGAGVDGVSVGDCVKAGRRAAREV
ncbi:hypothetical protein OF83DRAFT_1046453, partial [Amylostereum chailletii]